MAFSQAMDLATTDESLMTELPSIASTITSSYADKLGWSNEQFRFVDQELVRCRQQLSHDLSSRAYYDEARSDQDRGIDVYRIPASTKEAGRILEDFRSTLEAEIGSKDSAFIMDSLYSWQFGSFGKHDITIRFRQKERNLGQSTVKVDVYDFEYIDTRSGEVTLSGGGTLERLDRLFGKAFELNIKETEAIAQ